MSYAAMGTKCVMCGKPIHHRIESTGRTFPAGIEISDGFYYEHLKGEVCKNCDKKIPLEEKNPMLARVVERFKKQQGGVSE